jgi:hypothetical protein
MSLSLVVTAILVLSPAKVADVAITYAEPIARQSKLQSLDPLLTAAFIHLETGGQWDANMVSKTNDYGLMQNHVSRTTNAEYLGREHLLLVPETNIAVGTKTLAYWRQYHKRCKTQHHWWSHYKWGVNVKNDIYGLKIARVYARVKRTKLIAMEEHDHSNRGLRRLWESNTSGGGSSRAAAIDRYIVPEVRGSIWGSNNESSERAVSVLRQERNGTLVAVTRRRRSISGVNDDG